ncbi:LamG domain-containing protein [Candidatus Pacearchaeota archaeon]|nr:LamG domain-containing protein [Candidatus Pacearchaeota archaeon]
MKKKLVLIFILLFIPLIFAYMSSTNYNVSSPVVTSGGNASSTNYKTSMVLDNIIGSMSSSSYGQAIGFFFAEGKSNTDPTQTTPIINSTTGNNLTSDDLFCYNQSTSDIDGDFVVNSFSWYKNNVLNASMPQKSDDDLVLYLPFNKNHSSDNITRDYALSNDGEVKNGAVWNSSGKIGGGYEFDGTDDYVERSLTDSLNISGELTVSSWVYPKQVPTGVGRVIANTYEYDGGSPNERGWLLGNDYGSSDYIEFYVYNASGNSSSAYNDAFFAENLNKWTHVLGVFKPSQYVRLYVNGVLIAEDTSDIISEIAYTTVPLRIGMRADTTSQGMWNGSIDELAIYNRSLSASEISTLYQAGRFMHNSSNFYSQINSSETSKDDVWKCEVTPMDYLDEGTALNSSNLTIVNNTAPVVSNVILNSSSGTNKTTENLSVYYTSSDADQDSLTNITDWRKSGTSIAVLNMPFDSNISSTASDAVKDYSTYGNNGTIDEWGTQEGNIQPWTTGQVGNALQFDGSNDYVLVSDSASLDSLNDTGEFTLEAWIYPDAYPWNGIIGSNRIRFTLCTGTLFLDLYNTSEQEVQSSDVVNLNEWSHVAVTYDRATGDVKFYHLGGLAGTDSIHNADLDATSSFVIGEEGWSSYFDGAIDEVRIYNRTLNATEINWSYQRGLAGLPSNVSTDGLVLYVSLNETSGDTAADSSGEGNDGTLNGYSRPLWNSSGKIGGGYEFDGDDYVEVSDDSSLNISSQLTLEAWVYTVLPTANEENQFFIYKGYGQDPWSTYTLYFGWYNTFYFSVFLANGSSVGCGVDSPISPNAWNHFTGTFDEGIMKIYKNSVLINTCDYSSNNISFSDSEPLYVGYEMNGSIDEVKIYNYSLSPEQISANYNAGLANHSPEIIVSNETTKAEVWSCAVTPNDATTDGTTVLSNTLTIANTLPTVTLVSPEDENTTTNRTPFFSWSGSDDDGDSLEYELNLTLVASSLCTDPDRGVIGISDENYTVSHYLNCLYDNSDYYEWSVRASDDSGSTYGAWSSIRKIYINSDIVISLPVDAINFGSFLTGTNDTSDDVPAPFELQNDGNCLLNVSINATDLWTAVSNPSDYFKYKIDNKSGEAGAFNWLQSQIDWQQIPATEATSIVELNWSNSMDIAEIDLNVTVPSQEVAGDKSSTVYFIASLGE